MKLGIWLYSQKKDGKWVSETLQVGGFITKECNLIKRQNKILTSLAEFPVAVKFRVKSA